MGNYLGIIISHLNQDNAYSDCGSVNITKDPCTYNDGCCCNSCITEQQKLLVEKIVDKYLIFDVKDKICGYLMYPQIELTSLTLSENDTFTDDRIRNLVLTNLRLSKK